MLDPPWTDLGHRITVIGRRHIGLSKGMLDSLYWLATVLRILVLARVREEEP